MLRTTIGFVSLLALAGCVTQANLIGDNGQRHLLKIDPATKGLSTEIDSVSYKGRYIMGESAGAAFGARGGMAVTAGGGNNGQAVLTAANGDFIDCSFMASGSTVLGRCQSKAGKQYVLTTE